ncbi:hypothetical protein L1987_87650 [Smallanthus sonchifolius]|nr:hypothetical protein L1987_87650 [Smallanthus sonchifolius]
MVGLKEWLDAVSTARIPCVVVSSLDSRIMIEILEQMGFMKYFQTIVTEEDGMDSVAHTLLFAAVKVSSLNHVLLYYVDYVFLEIPFEDPKSFCRSVPVAVTAS